MVIIFPLWAYNRSGDGMRIWKDAVLGYIGGMIYVLLELLWRGWSHGSMFLVGGLCFVLIGSIDRIFPEMPAFYAIRVGRRYCDGDGTAVRVVHQCIYGAWRLGLQQRCPITCGTGVYGLFLFVDCSVADGGTAGGFSPVATVSGNKTDLPVCITACCSVWTRVRS